MKEERRGQGGRSEKDRHKKIGRGREGGGQIKIRGWRGETGRQTDERSPETDKERDSHTDRKAG